MKRAIFNQLTVAVLSVVVTGVASAEDFRQVVIPPKRGEFQMSNDRIVVPEGSFRITPGTAFVDKQGKPVSFREKPKAGERAMVYTDGKGNVAKVVYGLSEKDTAGFVCDAVSLKSGKAGFLCNGVRPSKEIKERSLSEPGSDRASFVCNGRDAKGSGGGRPSDAAASQAGRGVRASSAIKEHGPTQPHGDRASFVCDARDAKLNQAGPRPAEVRKAKRAASPTASPSPTPRD